MKLPFTLSTTLIFRLLFPGLVLAVAFAPLVHTLFLWIGIPLPLTTALPIEAVFWGWVVVLADLPIYMTLEGRRYWPRFLSKRLKRLEEKRLARLYDKAHRAADERSRIESQLELLNFPLNDEDDKPHVLYPTRLGNLLTAYETYPDVKYGLDGVFYWYRLWLVIDKDLRTEIDSSQAVADSGVYMCFGLWLSALLLLVYAIADGTGLIYLLYAPPWTVSLSIAAACVLAGYFIYRMSLFAHQQHGEMFKALFDQYHAKLEFVDGVVRDAIGMGADPHAISKGDREKYLVAWRFLRWHRIRPQGENRNYTPQAWKREQEIRSQPVDADTTAGG